MNSSWVKKITFWVEIVVVMAISIVFFEYLLQPTLANLNPMFADQYVPLEERSLRAPDTPAEVALIITGLIVWVLYMELRLKIDQYMSNS